MSLDQIRYFVAVAEQGTTRAAARCLSISQPPLTRCISALEGELGVQLFTRSSRGMSLRAEGKVFLRHARSILHCVDQAVTEVRAYPALPPADKCSDSGKQPEAAAQSDGVVPSTAHFSH